MPPIFSIITPVYNASAFIQKAILSLHKQSVYEWELLVINDASTDNSLAILEEFAGNDARIRIVSLNLNGGQGKARNLALKKAKGDYILFLDADDYLAKNALQQLITAIEKKPKIDVFIWGFSTFFHARNKKAKVFLPQKPDKVKGENPFQLGMLSRKGFLAYPWVYVVKKSFIKKYILRFSEGIFFEDIAYTTALLFYAKKVFVLRFVGYHYRKHKASVTGKASPKKIYDKFTAYDYLNNFLKERGVYSHFETLYNVRFLTFCVFTSFREYFSLSKKERSQDLDTFMLQARNSILLNTENLEHIRAIALSLDRKTDKEVQQMYFGAYTGLKSIKKRYGFYRFLVRLSHKINRHR